MKKESNKMDSSILLTVHLAGDVPFLVNTVHFLHHMFTY